MKASKNLANILMHYRFKACSPSIYSYSVILTTLYWLNSESEIVMAERTSINFRNTPITSLLFIDMASTLV